MEEEKNFKKNEISNDFYDEKMYTNNTSRDECNDYTNVCNSPYYNIDQQSVEFWSDF